MVSAKELNPQQVLEIPATCSKALIALILLISGIGGGVMLLIGTNWPIIIGTIYLCLAGYAGWLLMKNSKWHLSLETGECLLLSYGHASIKAFSIQDYDRVFINSRNHPVGSWSVTLSDTQGGSLILAPCVSREYAVEIAGLLNEKFGLKNHGMIG